MYMAIDELQTPHSGEPSPPGLQTSRRIVQVEGVKIFENFYFHRALPKFLGETVEVRYDVKNLSRVTIVLPDFQTVEATTIAVFAVEGDYATPETLLDDSLKLAETEAKNRLMEAALWQALEMRGIFAALSDSLALCSEKAKLRDRFAEIEKNIRAAISKNGGQNNGN